MQQKPKCHTALTGELVVFERKNFYLAQSSDLLGDDSCTTHSRGRHARGSSGGPDYRPIIGSPLINGVGFSGNDM